MSLLASLTSISLWSLAEGGTMAEKQHGSKMSDAELFLSKF
jgi:hypothetical protein